MSDSSDPTVQRLVPSKKSAPAQPPATGATVVKLKLSQAQPCEPPAEITDDKSEGESRSPILKATVTYACGKGSATASFIADHTGNMLFGGHGGIVAGPLLDRADRSLRKLVKLMDQTDEVLTVELWSLAAVAALVLKEAEDPGAELLAHELRYLKSFLRLVERQCADRYGREWTDANTARS